MFDLFTPKSRKQHHAPIPRAAIVEHHRGRGRGRGRAAGWLYDWLYGWLYKSHRKLYLAGALSIRAKYWLHYLRAARAQVQAQVWAQARRGCVCRGNLQTLNRDCNT